MGRILILAAVGVTWVVLTADRVHVWGDERVLWQDALHHAPEKPRVWVNLGRQYQLHGASLLAAHSYETAIALAAAPGRPEDEARGTRAYAEANLALIWVTEGIGDPAAADRLARTAVDRVPIDPTVARLAHTVQALGASGDLLDRGAP